MNVLSRPFYDLGIGQFAELIPRENPGAYSAPEYLSRSVLLSGRDYFVIYDAVVEPQLSHRFSWFVRRGDQMPSIQFVRGASSKSQDTHRTEIQTAETTGFWMDGQGDSMAVISHRKDLKIEAKGFGCIVHGDGIEDLIFRNPDPIHFSDGPVAFSGTSGLIRRGNDETGFALFHGTQIGVEGFSVATTDTEIGIGGTIAAGRAPQGEYFAPKAGSIRVIASQLSDKAVFYMDGEAQSARRDGEGLIVELKPGNHHWELTDQLPVPPAPMILRTENYAGGARVFLSRVSSATEYRIETSSDNGVTWVATTTGAQTTLQVNGLTDGKKIHVRAVALNAQHESAPGPEYPIYGTQEAPKAPDGLHVALTDGSATITWGEVLGVTEYRLYSRKSGEKNFRLVAHGLDRSYVDQRPEIRASLPKPDSRLPGTSNSIEYCITAVNGNGEGARSRVADTNPGSWRNWDPMPGEPFRRTFDDDAPSASIRVPTKWPRYYPQ